MFIEPELIVSATVAAFEHRKTIRQSAKRLWVDVTGGRVPILVFGAGGVGKSTLGHFLEAPDERQLAMAKYNRSTGREEYKVDGPVMANVYVPPGQEFRRAPAWTQLYSMLAKEKRVIVLNVVAHGYHVVALDNELLADLAKPNAKRKEVLEAFLAKGRAREIEVFREVTDHLCKIETRVLMLTLVMKQDLWWEDRVDVRKHYESGTYDRFLTNVREAKGNQNFRHVFASCSLLMNNLRADDGEVLFPTSRGYDESVQVAHQKKLIAELTSLLKDV